MKSVDKLRKFSDVLRITSTNTANSLDSYIERIEDEHARLMRQAIEKAHADGERSAMKQIRSSSVDYQKGYEAAKEESADMRDFCERVEDAAKNREEVTLFDVDYVPLPVDEDRVAIRPGNVIDGYGNTFEVSSLILTRFLGWVIETDTDERYEDSCAFKHHKEQDVTDILREFALACEDAGNAGPEVERIAMEYAEKLQLKGE